MEREALATGQVMRESQGEAVLSANLFVVTPEGEEGWRVLVGDTRSSRVFDDKADAIARAKELAMLAEGCLVVRDKTGHVQTERTFSRRIHVQTYR